MRKLIRAGLVAGLIAGALPAWADTPAGSLSALSTQPSMNVFRRFAVDRAKMNRAVFNALKPGGIYIVVDHSGRPGTGASETKSLHRIEESVVRREVAAAGFKLVAEADFLRNPNDPRDVPVSKSQVPNDEFILKFVKP